MRETGTYLTIGGVIYFIPNPLPPTNPPFTITPEIMALNSEAAFALGKLNEMSARLPDPQRFIKAYVIKEALLSSAIEGIHTTLIEVYTHQLEEDLKSSKNTQLVLNYTHALEEALKLMRDQGLPVVNRVILRAHEALMSSGEGDKSAPGQFRKQSVRVGDLVPPPAPEIPQLMGDLEKYINEPSELSPLINAGLAHVQFETIHPFLDGNGRIGRLLIVLMLIESGLLSSPILYPSYFFKKYHFEYYQKLDQVRTAGDFEAWIVYYLKGIRDSAIDAYTRAKDIENLEAQLKQLILTDVSFTKMRDTAISVLELLFTQPITGIARMSQQLDKAYNTIQKTLNLFITFGIVSENFINKRNKIYRFESYLALLEKAY